MSIDLGTAIAKEMFGHLASRNLKVDEGGSSPQELAWLIELVRRRNAVEIVEIGFNAGLSSFAFLTASADTRVTSFDIGRHRCVGAAKQYLDGKFPGRHTLILGDSRQTVPKYQADHLEKRFDLAFADGGHAFEVARADLINLKALCNAGSALVMDDLTPWLSWGAGPMKAWTSMIRDGAVVQDELYKDGEPVVELKPPGGRAWALGRYVYPGGPK